MKMVLKIAKTELRTLFYSPIAWFLMIVFLLQCGINYIYNINSTANTQEMGGRGLEYMSNLTSRIFTGQGGLFSSVMQNLYLYIPLLTMGLISKEINGGTMKLLYSSPVKVSEIVLGKYVSMMVYSLVLVLIVCIFMVAGVFNIVSADTGVLLSAVLGFYLLLCAYSAIGLFMSCLTTYQVVAAVSTFVMIGILSYIGTLWQEYDFVRDITYFLSLSGRTGHMLNGLITSKDVIYFLVIIYIFLGLSIYKLKAGRESKPALVKAGRYTAIVISALMIGYISSRPGLIGYVDTTANQTRTLTPNVQQIIHQFGDDQLEVTSYTNLMEQHVYLGLPKWRNNYLAMWEPYTRFKSAIDFKYVNYYDSTGMDNYMLKDHPHQSLKALANMYAKNNEVDLSLFKTSDEIRKTINLKPEHYRFVMQLKYKNKTTFLRVFDDQQMFPGETEVAAAFKRLLSDHLPKIGFLTGNLERSIHKIGERDYKTLTNEHGFRYALVNQGFDVDTISVETQDIPKGISTLVIADPKTSFSTSALARIKAYIDKGGNLLIAGEPGKQALLNPILEQLGVQLMEGAIVQPSKELAPDLVLNSMTATVAGFTKLVADKYKDSLPVSMVGATGLTYTAKENFVVKPLLFSDGENSWIKKDKIVADSAAIVFSAAQGDVKKSVPTALSLTRSINGKEQRIVVTGDADFMSNAELHRYTVQTANFFFNTALFSWLSDGEFPIDTSRPNAKDKRMKVTPGQVTILRIGLIWILPALLTLLGTILLIRRKRQ